MSGILENDRFAAAYQRLAEARLNPRRHTAANAQPARTRERRWVRLDEIGDVPLVDEALRPILRSTMGATDDPRSNI